MTRQQTNSVRVLPLPEIVGTYCPIPSARAWGRGMTTGQYRVSVDVGLERLCYCCGNYWPADSEFWSPRSDRACGVDAYCRACAVEYWREHYGEAVAG